MKTNNITPAEKAARKAATEKRLASMRAKLSAMECRADALLAKGDSMTESDRLELLSLVNIAYHAESSKIESIYSIDGSAACDFCQRMRKHAEDSILIICGFCYAAADAWKEAAWRRHKLNARILSSVLFTVEELKSLPIPEGVRVRINEDGDTVNQTHGQNILRIIAAFTTCRFGYWFKNTPAINAALRAEGIHTRADRPKNVRFVQSSILIGFPSIPAWFADIVFTVYPDAASTLAAVSTGAWECNGRKCMNCGFFCYTPADGKPVHVAEVLRTNKAKRALILEAYKARLARK